MLKIGCGETAAELRLLHQGATLYERMDHESLLVTLFFTFMLGAGVGFYLAKLLL